MSVDLPTLGMPQIKTRSGLTMPPRNGANSRQALMSCLAGAVSVADRPMARVAGMAL